MNEQPHFITMPEARHKRNLFGYPYEAADGASIGNARTAWGYVRAPLIDMGKRSAGLLMFRRRKAQLRYSSSIREDPFGKISTPAHGRYPKVNTGKRKIHSMRRSESSKRKQESIPQENSFPLIR